MHESIERLRGLESHLRANIIGQDHVLARVTAVFARGELGLNDPTRPRGSFLLVGPTGTGKSETFRCASDYVLGPGQLTCFDMSEYQDPFALSKLLGADRNDPGLLGRALLARNSGAILFDEMEKAHPRLLDVFLQMLWDGRITVATGQTFSLARHYLALASNLGGAEAIRMQRSNPASVELAVLRRVQQSLRAELVGRIDEVLVFGKLTPEAQRKICSLLVDRETARLRKIGFDLTVSRAAMEFLLREGFDAQLGARPLRRTVEREIQNAVTKSLFANGVPSGEVVVAPATRELVIRPI